MDNRLLRLRNKRIKDIKVTSKIKSVINEWYKKYQIGELKDERRNYLNFENNILKKLLGYKDEDFQFEYPLDGRSVEFMIMKDDKPYIAVELKGTQTKDLTRKQTGERYSAVEQASNYANKKSSIKWYIVSNYYEFRLYNSESQNKYISFTLDDLKPNGYDFDEKRISQFFKVFSREAVLEKDYLNKLYYSEGLFPEDFNLENEFYKLYNQTRLMIIKELSTNNPINKEEAIEYAQLILNRYIFVCFCEDKNLLPDSISSEEILTPIRRKVLAIATIWSRLNELFYFINNGNPDNDITGYNGGLFKEDLSHLRIRDKIEDNTFYKDINVKWNFPEQEHIIDHEIRNYPDINQIYRNLLIISSFDFQTDLTENILGHIFENSISDLEELKNEKESKRKKEGVYYTPEYITKYICENTIIPYLSNENNNTIESLIKEYKNNFKKLEDKLHNIKILDPACGSGAFLNKATDTLLSIHKAIFEAKNNQENNLDKEFDNIDNRRDILINNIHGVDLNHESIEITKLGLFLKVCKKGIKLPDLDKNIKCGNSLIDDSAVTHKPFIWKKEFKEVFNNGGFDIVIGNPPYVRIQNISHDEIDYYKNKYITAYEKVDLSILFIELSQHILKENGTSGLITSNAFLNTGYGKKLRELFLEKIKLNSMIDFGDLPIFPDALTYVSIFIFSKSKSKSFKYYHVKKLHEDLNSIKFEDIDISELNKESWNLKSYNLRYIFEKIKKHPPLIEIGKCWVGIISGADEIFIFDNLNNIKIEKDVFIPLIRSKDCIRYSYSKPSKYIIYPYQLSDSKTKILSETQIKEKYPKLFKYFKANESKLRKRKDSRKTLQKEPNWYKLIRHGTINTFKKEKIVFPGEAKKSKFSIDIYESGYSGARVFSITMENIDYSIKYLLAILNSKLIEKYIKSISPMRKGGYYSYSAKYMDELPIPQISYNSQEVFISNVENIMNNNEKLDKEIKSFHKYLVSDFHVTKINKKLTEYYTLSFEDLYKQVKKQYKQITRQEKDKLEDEYTLSIKIVEPLQKEIEEIDKKIDNLVYELYELTNGEIDIIEKSLE
ncbi:hypothetical protein SDC9_07624 [bioreactor metagenome]|uniref:site-specific DNA-methyltransferase (adenine-specific) n=1 Tax=bioreactor metagenome TaxID=1076179 RepID=A0A644T5E6_9ZZZZ|nr:DNA methyltransferase [Methanobrevibacter sp.]MEA4957745.1 DNA methyltransferase [Methanobrevibacter sp.]